MTERSGSPGAQGPRRAGTHATRRISARVRRRRLRLAVVAVAAFVAVLVVATRGPSNARRNRTAAHAVGTESTAIPAVGAGVLPWTLQQPLSREVLFPGAGNTVTVAGGLGSSGNSRSAVFSLDVTNGAETPLHGLASPVHDAAGAQLPGRDLVLGGGSATSVADVQSFAPSPEPGTVASVIGHLPQPRSDASAVVIGDSAYVVGGFDGTNPDPQVLATTDGQHFSLVANLAVPVRYAAVVAWDQDIFLFGGQAIGGPQSGSALDTIQMVDPTSRTSKVVGQLPQPTAGAAAAVIGGHIYVAGGSTRTSSTQEASASSAANTDTGAILAFDPGTGRMLNAGNLPVPVAYAAVQVVGSRAWIVGGEANGKPVDTVETFK